MRIEAWTGTGTVHLYRDCTGVPGHTRRVLAQPEALRCGDCIVRVVEQANREPERVVVKSYVTRTSYIDGKGRRTLAPCGTHAAFTRHKTAGEDPCADCVIGEREYQAARHQRRKAKRAQQAWGEAA